MNKKILIIGIDGASWTLFEPALDLGYMPFLKKMRDEGCSGMLKSTIPAMTPPAWGAFQTGKEPAEFGVFDFLYWDRKAGEFSIVDSTFLPVTVWETLSQRGYKIGLINLPMTYPPREINGYVISGILTPSLKSNFTYPHDLKNYLLGVVPEYEIINSAKLKKFGDAGDLRRLVCLLTQEIVWRTKAVEALLRIDKLDLLLVEFQCLDYLQHKLMHKLDTKSKDFDPHIRNMIFGKYLKVLDDGISKIYSKFLNLAGDPPVFMLVSDHGFQLREKGFYFGDFLYAKGLVNNKQKSTYSSLYATIGRLPHFIKSPLYNIYSKLKSNIHREVENKQHSLNKNLDNIDLNSSVFVPIFGDLWGGSYYFGSVNRKQHYVESLRKALYHLKDDEGQQLIERLLLKEELVSSPHENFPDILIKVRDGYILHNRVTSLGRYTCDLPSKRENYGYHHTEGIFVFHPSESFTFIKKQQSIVDFPNILINVLG